MLVKRINERGMSSIIGAFLVTALTLILVAMAGGLVIGAVNLQDVTPIAHLTLSDHKDIIDLVSVNNLAIINHRGGDMLNCTDFRILVFNSEFEEIDTLEFNPATNRFEGTKFETDSTLGDNRFEVGDTIVIREQRIDEVHPGDLLTIRIIEKLTYQIIFEDRVVPI